MAHHRRWTIRLAAALAVTGLAMAAAPPLPARADGTAFTFTDSRITECSGMATDIERGYYWTINDTEASGGRIYGVRSDGQTLTSIRFGADLVDTEALAYQNGSFYVADIGDNTASRTSVSVYKLTDPQVGSSDAEYTRYRFSYPDGAHDAEGMFLSSTGRIHIVTKEATGAIYVAPEKPSASTVNTLTKVASAPAYATDATRLLDGTVAIRTYTSVAVYDIATFTQVGSATTPTQQQGESIAQSMDGSSLLLGSEGRYSSVLEVGLPQATATPTATSSGSASASATATASATTGVPATGGQLLESLLGTRSMFLVAGAVAVLAGLVVFLRRR
ncbi:hypothetical protein [Propionicicella superfundia]|uniref:hypothetical protein n=1 Tax=Propionicicella superfundia TaxID=348582 RepID=UPI0003FFA051|nr:hypothetical protein [Propionicicella superfundia]